MGPSSVRRDILEKLREDKKGFGPGKGSRRARRGARAFKDGKFQYTTHEVDRNADLKGTTVPTAGLAQPFVNPQTPERIANTTGDKGDKGTNNHRADYGDDEEDDREEAESERGR